VSWLGEFFKAELPPELDNVRRWLERVKSRPSWNA
jgi:hypothetical protein